MKNNIVIFCTVCILTILVGCTGKEQMINKDELKTYNLSPIEYVKTVTAQPINAEQVNLALYPITEFAVGEEVSIRASLNVTLPSNNPYYYCLADWGDGTWSYNGPYINSNEKKSNATLTHKYHSPGEYDIKVAAVELSTGQIYGWSETETYTITSEEIIQDNLINNLLPISSSDKTGLEFIVDNNRLTAFTTIEASEMDDEQWIGLLFDDLYQLDHLEVQIPVNETFPSNIAIEYTTDFGETWQSLPKYYYLYDYSVGRYSPIMRFPNPNGATLSLPLDGIVGNGIRISAKLFLTEPRTLSVSEMRVYGDKALLLYTSKGGSFDGDLNNMWTIFGTAKTEPIVYGSINGESTNQSPFRTGMTMIASTEWLQWNGQKLVWSDYPEAKEAYLNQLINVRTGPDGWSGHNGYVYATSDSPKHLGEQNHYTYNQIFIMAVRDYLFHGNNTQVYQYGKYVNLLEAENRLGQSINERIDLAMDYMLTALDGESGIMTINDPDNDGTTSGNASNYWDTHRAFGYKSAYENALFYGSLIAMAEIKTYLNDNSAAEYYYQLAEKAKEEYNKLFWDEAKGRYITSVNIKGERIDFGMTFVNFYATAFGVATEERAKLIYDWVDGKRIIPTDTSTGKDIYGAFIYSARTNTVDVSSTGAPYYWWDHGGALPPVPGAFGGYDHQMQNGGTIFYISYYDLMGRIKAYGANNAFTRFNTIIDEFHIDALRRNSYRTFTQAGTQGIGEYREGVIGEFPESGLVPLTFISGFLGINVSSEGLEISPNLPDDLSFAGVREYNFGNRVYSIQVAKAISTPVVEYDGSKYFVKLPADKDYVITLDNRLLEK